MSKFVVNDCKYINGMTSVVICNLYYNYNVYKSKISYNNLVNFPD